ncbi:MAG: cbb3-type cytochrome c oxidase N-terminal domain-containing protein [Cyclobacteriaceae bacterium]
MHKYKYLLLSILGLVPQLGFSQQKDAGSLESLYSQYQLEIVIGTAILVAFVAVLALLVAMYALQVMSKVNNPSLEEESLIAVQQGEEGVGFWRRFWNRINDSVPLAQENTVMTDHSYDGIRELDNRLPPWWLYGFYATIVFGIIYLTNVFILDGPSQKEEYEQEMAQAKIEVETYLASLDNLIDESNVSFSEDKEDLIAGKEVFISKCAACHGQNGEGGIGPNFTDEYWIHGGDVGSIFKTVKYGVPAKGMIAWKAQLSPKQMQQVSSYIVTLEGTDPPNQKEAQGERYEREEEETQDKNSIIEAGM